MAVGETVIHSLEHGHPGFARAVAIRHRVFVDEQGVPVEDELDAFDVGAVHLLAVCGDEAVGTARFYDDGGWQHIGRLAVLPEFRGRGIGVALLARCLEEGRALGFRRVFLNSLTNRVSLYAAHGFYRIGDEFLDGGSPHVRMELVYE